MSEGNASNLLHLSFTEQNKEWKILVYSSNGLGIELIKKFVAEHISVRKSYFIEIGYFWMH